MWEVITSYGHRVRDIQHESDAMRAVHALGLTTLIAPYRYLVSDHRGQRFVAEVHRQPTLMPARPTYRPIAEGRDEAGVNQRFRGDWSLGH